MSILNKEQALAMIVAFGEARNVNGRLLVEIESGVTTIIVRERRHGAVSVTEKVCGAIINGELYANQSAFIDAYEVKL